MHVLYEDLAIAWDLKYLITQKNQGARLRVALDGADVNRFKKDPLYTPLGDGKGGAVLFFTCINP